MNEGAGGENEPRDVEEGQAEHQGPEEGDDDLAQPPAIVSSAQ